MIRFNLFIFIGIFGFNSISYGETIPFEFKRNEILSSSVLNDQFKSIERSQLFYEEKFLRGVSDCVAYGGRGFFYTDRGFTLEAGSLFSTLDFTITVNDQDVVTFTPFDPINNNSNSGMQAAIAGDQLIFIQDSSDNFDDRLDISISSAEQFSLQGTLANAICRKRLTIPSKPDNLTISIVDQDSVGLSWVDNSNNEITNEVLITDSNSVTTAINLGPDVNSYIHTFSGDGRFEFRVRALNNEGESLGSNAAFAEVVNGQIQVF